MIELTSAKLMLCRLCLKRFSDDDVASLSYFADTGICFECYERGKKKHVDSWCFGKREAYDPLDAENRSCTELCPDKKYCPLFVSGEIYKLRYAVKEVMEMHPQPQPARYKQ